MVVSRGWSVALVLVVALFLGVAFLAGRISSSSSIQPDVSPTSTRASIAVATSPPHAATATLSATPTPLPSHTSSQIPELTPSPYPTITPYPSPTPFVLSSPHPTDLDLVRLVVNKHPPGYYAGGLDEKLAQGTYDTFERKDIDVNGDGEQEVIVIGDYGDSASYVSILQYDDTLRLWQELYYLSNYADWTGHEIGLQLKNDYIEITRKQGFHGTGILGARWDRGWIRCGKDSCKEIWTAPMMYFESQIQGSVESVYYETISSMIVRGESISLTRTSFGFAIERIWESNNDSYPGTAHKTIGPVVTETFTWDGTMYKLQEVKETTPQQEIVRESDRATNTADFIFRVIEDPYRKRDPIVPTFIYVDRNGVEKAEAAFWGINASPDKDPIWGSKVFHPQDGSNFARAVAAARTTSGDDLVAAVLGSKRNDKCRLVVHKFDGKSFDRLAQKDLACTPNFTRVAWMDLDLDGNEELLFSTILPNQVSEQKLYAYSVTNDLKGLFQLSGSFNGVDGAGIRWESTKEGARFFSGVDPTADCKDFSCLDTGPRWKIYHWDAKTGQLVKEQKP